MRWGRENVSLTGRSVTVIAAYWPGTLACPERTVAALGGALRLAGRCAWRGASGFALAWQMDSEALAALAGCSNGVTAVSH